MRVWVTNRLYTLHGPPIFTELRHFTDFREVSLHKNVCRIFTSRISYNDRLSAVVMLLKKLRISFFEVADKRLILTAYLESNHFWLIALTLYFNRLIALLQWKIFLIAPMTGSKYKHKYIYMCIWILIKAEV